MQARRADVEFGRGYRIFDFVLAIEIEIEIEIE